MLQRKQPGKICVGIEGLGMGEKYHDRTWTVSSLSVQTLDMPDFLINNSIIGGTKINLSKGSRYRAQLIGAVAPGVDRSIGRSDAEAFAHLIGPPPWEANQVMNTLSALLGPGICRDAENSLIRSACLADIDGRAVPRLMPGWGVAKVDATQRG